MNASKRRIFLRPTLGAAAVALASASALAQGWPAKPITVMVAFPPGTPGDVTLRAVAPAVGKGLGQTLVIENRGGAAGNIGAEVVSNATADGYTLLEGPDSIFTINPHIYKKINFSPESIVPVTALVNFSQMLVCHPSVPANSVTELTDLGRKTQVQYASGGAGSPGHLVMEMYLAEVGIAMVHVPYKGPGPATQDLLGGQVPCGFLTTNVVAPHVKAGRLKGLAISGRKRSVLVPEVPTMHEAGVKGFDATFSEMLYAPRNTPQEIIQRVQEEVSKALADPEVRSKLLAMDMQPVGGSGRDAAQKIKVDSEKWGAVVRKVRLAVD